MADTPPRHILIFEPDERGHAREWLEHLTHFAAEQHPDLKLTLAIPRHLAQAIRVPPSISIETLSEEEERRSLAPKLAVSGMGRWNAMQTHLASSGADYGFFLGLDHITLPLALGLRARRPVSGILFRPSAHYDDDLAASKTSLKERIRDLRKRLLYTLMLRNPSLDIVFSLDPYFLSTTGASKVRGLVDPAFPLPAPPPETATARPRDGRILFLLFGEISERKGLLALFDALARLAPETAARMCVLIAGRIDPALRELAAERANALRSVLPLRLSFDDRFLPAEELAGLVRRADVILAPYQRFVGSSGVMLWAASAGKPIITQDYGLIGRLTREHGLGLAIDTIDAAALASAIARAVTLGPGALAEKEAMVAFAAYRTPRRFAATIFDGILKREHNETKHIASEMPQPRTGHASSLR